MSLFHSNYCLLLIRSYATRITLPHRVVERHKKATLKKAMIDGVNRSKGPPVISCSNPKYNHYKGQIYSNFTPQLLASSGWKKGKSNGQYFTINAFRSNPAFDLQGDPKTLGVSNFADLGINKEICNVLHHFSITKPTNIQAQAIPHILHNENVLCTAETGSGKTLAFLLPIIQKLLDHNKIYRHNTKPNKPFGLILVPSRELADQIHSLSNELGEMLGFNSYSQCGGRRTQKLLRERTKNVADIIVTTPGVFSKILTNRIYDLSRLNTIVLDEIDTLLDDSFNELVLRILSKINISCGGLGNDSSVFATDDEMDSTSAIQMVLCGATVPRRYKEIIKDILPNGSLVDLKTKSVHKLMPHVSQKFYRVSSEDKFELLLKHLKQNEAKKLKTMVFCNSSKKVLSLKFALEDNNINVLTLHAQSSSQKRENIFMRYQGGECDVLVCTDLASRGLDTVKVHQVINYEFPHYISDYIHRAGRVGRVGGYHSGFIINFISKKWNVDLVWNIETATRQMTELQYVNANIKRRLNDIIKEKFSPENSSNLLT